MAAFSYMIKNAKGARIEGILKASSMDEAVEKLNKEGGTIISVKPAKDSNAKKNMSLIDKLLLSIYKMRNSIPLKILVFFTRQLSTMFSAGLTIEKSIYDLSTEEKNKKFKKVLIKISNDIKKGFSLSEAMEQHPGIFNSLYISLVKAGEVSGTLHTVLDELSDYLEKIEDTQRKVLSALTYPVFIIFVLVAVVFFLFYVIIPKFSEIYSRFDAELPAPTVIAINISNFLQNHLFIAALMVLGGAVSVFLIYLTERGKFVIDAILLKIPVTGNLLDNSIMSKFARTFSILMAAGVPIMETMELVENVVQNAVIGNAIRTARKNVREGYSIAGALRKTKVFPSTLIQLTATGEETGDMDRLLGKAAQFYEKLVDSVIDRLTSLIEPLLIVMMAVVVGSTILVIYLPIFELGNAISQGMK